MADNSFDIVVIGAGPGGYVAAIKAAQLGYKTACVEEGNLGGVCLNIGCIPTKALLESAAMITHLGHAKEFGVTVGEIKTDMAQAVKRSRQVSERLVKGIGFLFKKNKVTHVQGRGRLVGNGQVEVTGKDGKTQTIGAKHIIVATGSRPRDLPFLKIDHDRVWDSTDAMMSNEAPKSLAVVGAGAIGCEFADVYAAFGTQVTIIEMADRVLPLEDRDCSAVVEKSYRKRGMNILTGVKLEKAEIGKGSVKLTITDAKGATQVVEAERVLSAIGRVPLVEDIGLEKAGVKMTDRGFIAIDRQMKTNVPGIYAIGDVAGPPLLAHKGSHEGVACVEAIHGDPHAGINYANIPNCTYCHPEVASVGLTEEQARAQGLDIEVGTFPWTANGRALTAGDTDGFVKVIRDKKYSEVVGAHIVGPHATELIAEFVVGRHLETTMEEMDRAMHPHPTLSEAVAEAALASLGHALHI
ncbi:dihydrolipoyl dehydrogenase [Longimicrobium sp.]|uniref:dihydrolipoyl dehydrogenase n=1 Tax=Longimicrobium sp. TaxID=2029185 RepID=UPI002E33EEDB|nr:dihydrolipoyl dehydrogenase [Longimicrobium sp.]HEX6042464.1 dihydrolipoyl dehydrogenase [Longimicrobium sp.]